MKATSITPIASAGHADLVAVEESCGVGGGGVAGGFVGRRLGDGDDQVKGRRDRVLRVGAILRNKPETLVLIRADKAVKESKPATPAPR